MQLALLVRMLREMVAKKKAPLGLLLNDANSVMAQGVHLLDCHLLTVSMLILLMLYLQAIK